MITRGCFVTGTDTEVGKTRVSAAMLYLLGQAGEFTAGYKPVAAGLIEIGGRLVNEDVQALRAASSVNLTDAQVSPCQLHAACAPHIAAALEGHTIDSRQLLRGANALTMLADWLVIEGVGGFRVPLGPNWDSADLACDFDLPVVLVVGVRLGCLSHALLTAEAVRGRGLQLAGWVANTIDPKMPYFAENVAMLRQGLTHRYGAPCLGVVPWLAEPTPAAVAAYLDPDAVRAALQLAMQPWEVA